MKVAVLSLLILSNAPLALAREKNILSPSEAIAIAKDRHGGKVLSAELVKGNPPYYRIKIESKGKVEVIRVEAGE